MDWGRAWSVPPSPTRAEETPRIEFLWGCDWLRDGRQQSVGQRCLQANTPLLSRVCLRQWLLLHSSRLRFSLQILSLMRLGCCRQSCFFIDSEHRTEQHRFEHQGAGPVPTVPSATAMDVSVSAWTCSTIWEGVVRRLRRKQCLLYFCCLRNSSFQSEAVNDLQSLLSYSWG